jgi:putative sigma-54 modulation protein
MKIVITGRHIDVSDDLKEYVEKKFNKLEKYFHRPIDIQITMYMEKHVQVIEAVINAEANRFYGIEKADDMYHSIDLLAKSMEKQALKHKEKHTGHKAVSPAKAEQAAVKSEKTESLIYRYTSDKPKDEIEAFLEMKIEKRDFILFKKFKEIKKPDYEENYALIYKNEDGFKMVETPGNLKNEKKPFKKLTEFDIIIKNDSITKPKIKFKKCRSKSILNLTVIDAIEEIMERAEKFLPFFNNETNHLNIIFKSENGIELFAPPK